MDVHLSFTKGRKTDIPWCLADSESQPDEVAVVSRVHSEVSCEECLEHIAFCNNLGRPKPATIDWFGED